MIPLLLLHMDDFNDVSIIDKSLGKMKIVVIITLLGCDYLELILEKTATILVFNINVVFYYK